MQSNGALTVDVPSPSASVYQTNPVKDTEVLRQQMTLDHIAANLTLDKQYSANAVANKSNSHRTLSSEKSRQVVFPLNLNSLVLSQQESLNSLTSSRFGL